MSNPISVGLESDITIKVVVLSAESVRVSVHASGAPACTLTLPINSIEMDNALRLQLPPALKSLTVSLRMMVKHEIGRASRAYARDGFMWKWDEQ